jgi:hypothetical protein
MKKGSKATLNYSGLKVEGTLHFFNSNTFVFQFKIICPFTKIERLQNFIKSDILTIHP